MSAEHTREKKVRLTPLPPRLVAIMFAVCAAVACAPQNQAGDTAAGATGGGPATDDLSPQNLAAGQQIFRFETFGDEKF